ncbi:MAG TPA: isoleucine--tRNA ligase [Armatimonadota bacterium]|nr:isoleucine--tRNA ligase [Armatimonadota bacterium]
MGYSDTLNLPKTAFPMKADLATREPDILKLWEDLDLYRLVRSHREGCPKWILHDGPPYSNGDIHIGTAQNKILKDISVKYRTMRGYDCPYVPGWDNHGLPLEQVLYRETGRNWRDVGALEWRQQCHELALRYVERQGQQFRRLGVRGDWDHPYLTLRGEYEAEQIRVFGEIARAGHIYRGLRPVYWCGHCETALADAEIEYTDKTSDSIYVRFPWNDDRSRLSPGLSESDRVSVVIWTTTPWTLPANMAIAVHPDARYVVAFVEGEYIIVAEALLDRVLELWGAPKRDIIATHAGKSLEGCLCRHPFADRSSPIVLAEYVTLEDGTGCVHTAPGHGEDDFNTGRQYGLPVLSPLNDRAELTEAAGIFAGKYCEDANADIIAWLRDHGYLVQSGKTLHQYPHCWRCHHPIAFRATEQWFINMERLRAPALEAVSRVQWVPSEAEQRITGMMATRPDWCISRQRVWGVPFPIFHCPCGAAVFTREATDAVAELFRREGSDAWWQRNPDEILPQGFVCPECGGAASAFRKETDIMDVWFDSGTSYAGVLDVRPDLGFPADVYLEGSDQHRGWFQSSLLTAMAYRGTPPYRTVVTHGFVVDEQGRKMSKSLGNTIDPQEICQTSGADILRWWVCSVDCKRDLHCSAQILEQVANTYVRVRNTCRFLLGNLGDFDPVADGVPYTDLPALERWVLARLAVLIDAATAAYEAWDFHQVYQDVHSFCAVDLSTVVLDVLKDRLYVEPAASRARRAAQTALYAVLSSLTRLLAPMLTFTTEEIWQVFFRTDDLPTVQLAAWPESQPEWRDDELLARFDRALELRREVYRGIERARESNLFKKPLDGQVAIEAPAEYALLVDQLEAEGLPLAEFLIVSRAVCGTDPVDDPIYESDRIAGLRVAVSRAEGERCPRCWHVVPGLAEGKGLCARCAEVVM